MNQKGFATLEVILMVVVIGILASVAVPRFTDITTKANTAKIQADLSTLDSVLQVYYMDNGKYPEGDGDAWITKLVTDGYLNAEVKPPTGKAYIKTSTDAKAQPTDIPATAYSLGGDATSTNRRAQLGTHTVGDFIAPTKSSTSTTNPE